MSRTPLARSPHLCPICKKPIDDVDRDRPNPTAPFCSERCKLVDLGRWLGGRYQIPVAENDESDPRKDPD